MARDWIGLYLEEDLGDGDITGDAVFPAEALGRARVVARERLVVAGLRHVEEVFRRRGCTARPLAEEGAWAGAGDALAAAEGPVRGLLSAERVALNILARMSGVATRTRLLQDRLRAAGSNARVAGTRKTTPGFRLFEKEAIRTGGGDPHRMGLHDEAMVKDNHLAAASGDVSLAVARIRAAHPDAPLTVEAESLEDALAAAAAGADWVMLDNLDPATGEARARELRRRHPGVRVEASGGIQEDDVEAYGWADRVSLGALTHRARGMDVSLEWAP